ncbi:MAG: hypothetical protein JRN53_03670 [Nitrososphaerota archaeon]|nr:hypothetical protein [Nitrososphaerota archaeon]MDG7046671.1 hypothetical protein [Nitrososphaerota archaeon]
MLATCEVTMIVVVPGHLMLVHRRHHLHVEQSCFSSSTVNWSPASSIASILASGTLTIPFLSQLITGQH